jgi:hypothetical protein
MAQRNRPLGIRFCFEKAKDLGAARAIGAIPGDEPVAIEFR